MKDKIFIIIGSHNPVKIQAAQHALALFYPNADIQSEGVAAPSLVSEQPMTEKETQQGAINRLKYCQAQANADYYFSMEGGVDNFSSGPATFAYVAISDGKHQSVGRSANLPIPKKVFQQLLKDRELGDVMDELFGTTNIKQAGGAIGLLTGNKATRESIYTQAIVLAMAPLLNPTLYDEQHDS